MAECQHECYDLWLVEDAEGEWLCTKRIMTRFTEVADPGLVLIPAGPFLMGEEKQSVDLNAYEISKYPVTNAQYAEFVEATLHSAPKHWKKGVCPEDRRDHPVVNVRLRDAATYCLWLSDINGKSYRLPTEAEWEKAARGTDGRVYPWGDQWDVTRCNMSEGDVGDTTPVGQYSPDGDSPYGVVDVVGNVWEWTTGWQGKHYNSRIVRGGCWGVGRRGVRCTAAFRVTDDAFDYVGFRVVCEAEEKNDANDNS